MANTEMTFTMGLVRKTDNDLKFACEEAMMERINPLLDYWHNVLSKKNDKFRYYEMRHIMRGSEMRCTAGNLVKMSFYNVSYQVPGTTICKVDAIVNPVTMDYTIKNVAGYGNFNYVREFKNGEVMRRDELPEVQRIFFDAMTAVTLWSHAYDIYYDIYPISSKYIQKIVFGSIAADTF